jgi:HK97 family phage portal protein
VKNRTSITRVKPLTGTVHFAGMDFQAPVKHDVSAKGLPYLSYPVEAFFGITQDQLNDMPLGARRAFRVFSLVYACMTFRATKLTEPPVWIAEEEEDGEHMLEGEHELSELLEQPNPDMEMAEFLTYVSLYLDSSGQCLIVKNSDRGEAVRSMYPYPREDFSVEPSGDRLYGEFKVQTRTGYRTLGPDQVIYLKRPSTEHILASVSPLEAALEHVNMGDGMRKAVRAMMRNAVRPGGIARASKELGPDTFDRLNAEIKDNWAGEHNTGKSLLLEGIDEWQVLSASLKDLELGPVSDDVEAAICQVFQMHPLLVGAKFGVENLSGFADSLKPALDLFYDLAVFPTWSWLEKKFTRALLRPIDSNPRRFIRFDKSKVRALAPDMTEKVAQAKAADGIWTEAEQRAHTGKEGGSEELPSDRAARVAEEQAAMAQENGNDEDEKEKPLAKANRIVDLVKTDEGWRATVSASRNGNGTH